MNEFCSEDQHHAQQTDVNIYQYLDGFAEKINPGCNELVILPYFLGEKSPIFDTNARGVIFGLTLSHSRYDIYRAVLEAVVFGFLHHIDIIRRHGLPIRRIIASEGGARSHLWRQIAADVIGMPVGYLKDNPGSAYGAALVAGVGVGTIPSWEGIKQFIQIDQQSHPDNQKYDIYVESYRIYLSLYPALMALTK